MPESGGQNCGHIVTEVGFGSEYPNVSTVDWYTGFIYIIDATTHGSIFAYPSLEAMTLVLSAGTILNMV